MKAYKTLFFIFLLSFEQIQSNKLFKRKKLTIILDKFLVPCPGMENSTVLYYNVKVINNKQNGSMLINYEMEVKEDVNSNIKLALFIQRCRSREALDTCAKFTTFKTDRSCQMLEQTTEVWSPFTNCLEPAWKCPIKKGHYVGKNCFLDMEAYNWFPLDGSYWKFTLQFIHSKTKKLLLCSIVEGYPKRI